MFYIEKEKMRQAARQVAEPGGGEERSMREEWVRMTVMMCVHHVREKKQIECLLKDGIHLL